MTVEKFVLPPGSIFSTEETEHVTSAASVTTSDFTSNTIDCRGYDRLELQLKIKAAGDPVGVIYITRAMEDVSAAYAAVAIDANKMDTTDTTAITHTSADYRKIVVADPAADAYVQLIFVDLPSFMKVFWDRTSGGASSGGLMIKYKLRVARHAL